jgi:hypothetical protein
MLILKTFIIKLANSALFTLASMTAETLTIFKFSGTEIQKHN